MTRSISSNRQTKLPLGKRELSKAANREAILDAARLVFAELGYEATTVRDIIRRTELASGTFYNYFKSKEEIHDALVEQTVVEFGQLLRTLKHENMSIEDYLNCALGAYFQFITRKHEKAMKHAGPHYPTSATKSDTPEMKAVFQEIQRDVENALTKEGYSGIDAEYLTASAIGIAREVGQSMLLRIAKNPERNETEIATQFASQLLLGGLRHKSA